MELEDHQFMTTHAEHDEEGEGIVGIEQMEVLTSAQDELRTQQIHWLPGYLRLLILAVEAALVHA